MSIFEFRGLVLPVVTLTGLILSYPAHGADPSSSGQDGIVAASVDPFHGAYAGVLVGVTGGGGTIDKGAGFDDFEHGEGRTSLGGHVGYNFGRFGGAANGGWVLSTEFDISSARLNADETDPVLGKTKLDGSFLASARLRGGYAWDNVFLYGTVGFGFTDMTFQPAGFKDDSTEISAGVAYGAGVEFAFAEQWSARVEAIAYDFGERDYKFNGVMRDLNLGMGTVRLGVSRQF